MPCSRTAISFRRSQPAREKLTDARRIENGSASTTRSAVIVFVDEPCLNVSSQRPAGGDADRGELRARRDLARESVGRAAP